MRFNVFKNTVLLFVLAIISCGSNSQKEVSSLNLKNKDSKSLIIDASKQSIHVGANQTELYLPLLKNKRIGVVANQTSVIFKDTTHSVKTNTNSNTHIVDSLLALNIKIKKVFAPEHGFRGNVDAGETVKDGIDTKTNLPIISLYGKNKKPSKEQLKNLDMLIFDIQDVGVRFYTYISSLHYIMEACAELSIPVLILDRPNPNGHYIDGPVLEIKNKSFLGMHPIPLVHGMTIGEYAQMINGEQWLANSAVCNITVIPVKNYKHNTPYSLPIRPSPNLPNDQAIKLYPSLGLFEGTNVNAGRGTEFQFQRYGAPFLDKKTLTFSYTPISNFGAKHPKHKNVICYGKDLKDETLNGVMTLKWIIDAYQNSTDKSLFFNKNNFTKHAGTDKLQQQIEANMTEKQIKPTWAEGLENFKKTRKKYLIYS
ncbi:DUF1343 domain-containing protein [uncultured Algibacter sp.]|uniref:exo-beta-N-acetylmuramidase NamZ family protein n=1 Tax=uncultured Algibacter sp. TaxID=298659 RepID=UPI003216ACA8